MRKSTVLGTLTLIAIATWSLVIRQEMQRRRPPAILAPGTSITLPAPGAGPTEESPLIDIIGTIIDEETGQPVFADVVAGPVSAPDTVSLNHVSEFRLVFPARDEAITITVTAPGYQKWSVEIKPHVVRSKRLEAPVRLKRKPAGDQAWRLSAGAQASEDRALSRKRG